MTDTKVTTEGAAAFSGPRPVLEDGALYFSDNGRLICATCAGCSALYTGRDISGQKVQRVNVDDATGWLQAMGRPISCEAGCLTLSTMCGPDGWPAVQVRR